MALKIEVEKAIDGLDDAAAIKVGKYMQSIDSYEKEKQMTYEEAKYIITQLQDEYADYNDERSIIAEALVIAKEAMEKQIAKKPIATEEFVRGCCPNCKEYADDDDREERFKPCPHCGQALDWSEE